MSIILVLKKIITVGLFYFGFCMDAGANLEKKCVLTTLLETSDENVFPEGGGRRKKLKIGVYNGQLSPPSDIFEQKSCIQKNRKQQMARPIRNILT